jgi:hypothetical protein
MTLDVAVAPEERAVVLRTLLLDAVAAQCTALLAEHGVPAILLKGRVLASWLYRGEVRRYGDVDLLVDPVQRDRAVQLLGTLGYRHWLEGAAEVEYGANELELVGPNSTCIDLHHTLLGVTASPARCWAVLSRRTERMTVGGRAVTVLDPAARTMHLALHVAQNGPADVKAVADLERGLAQVSDALWVEAADIAHAVCAREAFSAGLHAVPAGRRMAARLGLRETRDVELVLRSWSVPAEALQIQRFIEARTFGRRLRFVGRKLWPTVAYMAGRNPMARGGPVPLLGARLRRLVGLPGKVSVALWNWSRARRTVRNATPTDVPTTCGKGHS